MDRICVLVTGNIVNHSRLVIDQLEKFGYPIILVTNIDCQQKVESIECEKIFIDCPNHGIGNRNIQRAQVVAGLKRAQELGFEYCLKWRSDLFPVKLDLTRLLTKISHDQGQIIKKIALTAWRNRSVYPDHFSSIPDLFMFSSVDALLLMWGDSDFNYSAEFNLPKSMHESFIYPINGSSIEIFGEKYNIATIYDNHTELYALYKERLELRYRQQLSHTEICQIFFYFLDEREINYCWLGSRGFRPRTQAPQFLWKKKAKSRCELVEAVGWQYDYRLLYRAYSKITIAIDIIKQNLLFFFAKYCFYKKTMS
jgi:hypothetical protein